jgi:hypothetical protein
MAYLSGLFALAFWPWRTQMKRVKQGIIVLLILLDICMKASIWYLLAKISTLSGGDGWYRSYLMEQCANHFSDWWLRGTDQTQHWAVTLLRTGGADLCNMYVACAATAGLGCLTLFLLLLSRCFKAVGLALNAARQASSPGEIMLWCMGCVLFVHVVNFFSVTYWDQMEVVWWGSIAAISSITSTMLAQPEPEELVQSTGEMHPAEVQA